MLLIPGMHFSFSLFTIENLNGPSFFPFFADFTSLSSNDQTRSNTNLLQWLCALSCGGTSWLSSVEVAQSSVGTKMDMIYEIGELFELGIQLSYLLVLLGLLGVGTFFVIRQVLVRRELDLSAKELQVRNNLCFSYTF